MTPPTEVDPSDADSARRQRASSQPLNESEAPTTSPAPSGDKPSYDADTPSPAVVPVYLRPVPAQAETASQAAPAVPTTQNPPTSAPVAASPAAPVEATPAATATSPLVFDPEALADTICQAITAELYRSMRAVVVAAIQAAQQEPVRRDFGQPPEVTKADAPTPPSEGPTDAPSRAPDSLRTHFMGRMRPFSTAEAAWARHLSPRRGSGPSAPWR